MEEELKFELTLFFGEDALTFRYESAEEAKDALVEFSKEQFIEAVDESGVAWMYPTAKMNCASIVESSS